MNFKLVEKFSLVLILLLCHFSNVFSDGTSPDSDAFNGSNEAQSENIEKIHSSENIETTQITTNNETSTDTNEQTPNKSAECAKHCQNSSAKKYQQNCVIIGYKSVENLETKAECLVKCKNDASCISATYIEPRSPTAFDLKSLYDKVIDSETWIPIKKFRSLATFASQLDTDSSHNEDLENDNEMPNGADFDEDFQNHALVNISFIKTNFSGSCYLYDTSKSAEQKLECLSSRLTFEYEQIDCFEDPNCVKPKRQCPCGRCGNHCKEFPNACMGKYFFGHLTAINLESCLEFCLETPGCKSVDFGHTESCLINHVDRNDTQLTLGCDRRNNEVWDYYEMVCDSECPHEKPRPDKSEDTCTNVPGICQNGGNCETIQLPPPHQSFTYGCHCPCNWCGKHCEKLNMKTYKNGCLNSSVIAWSVAENSGDCVDMCLNEIHCKSVSFSATAGTCVLHWADPNNVPIISSPHCPNYRIDATEKEWSLHEIICDSNTCHSEVEVIEAKEVKGCASNPCLNGGECADIFKNGHLSGYHCLCKCGYCGDRCENQNYAMTENACIWGSHISNSPSDYYRKSVSLDICLSVCATKYPLCRSVDYSNKGECLLNKKDSDLAAITPKCNNYLRQRWNLYDLSCVCHNKPVIYTN